MSDELERIKRDMPELVQRELTQPGRRLLLQELFPGDEWDVVRKSILEKGSYVHENGRRLHIATRKVGEDAHEVVAVAAVSRDPGRTQDYLDTIADFRTTTGANRPRMIQQYWKIYETEGVANNAVNKYAALLSVGGRYKVRKARKGKQQKAVENAQIVLDFFSRRVNAPNLNGVATAARGLKALTEQGLRVVLVEGDYIGRMVWDEHEVPGLSGRWSMPLTIQTLTMEQMEADSRLNGLGEFWYWKPPAELLRLIRDPSPLPKELQQVIKRAFSGVIGKQLQTQDKALLDPALLIHAKHRGSDRSPYGESFLEPAKLGIRYLRAVTGTDQVSMESVVNRLMIVMVGSDDPNSPYSKSDVAQARTALMQSFFEEAGPSMTIVWQGNDVKVENVGAMESLLDLREQHKIGERKVTIALGIPSALLDGSAGDGRAAGWAAWLAASGQAEHLGSRFANIWTEVGERILEQNGFTDIEVVYEYDRTNLADQNEERTQTRNDYLTGALSIRTYLLAINRDPDAEFLQRCFERGLDTGTTTWEEAFRPPQGLQGQSDGGIQGQGPGKTPGEGRTPDDQAA